MCVICLASLRNKPQLSAPCVEPVGRQQDAGWGPSKGTGVCEPTQGWQDPRDHAQKVRGQNRERERALLMERRTAALQLISQPVAVPMECVAIPVEHVQCVAIPMEQANLPTGLPAREQG